MIPTDQEIIELFHEDNRQGFKMAFDKYYTLLCIHAGQITGDLHLAEDVVQSVFIKCWENQSFFTVHSSLRSYLFTAVRNASINQIKQYRNEELTGLDSMTQKEADMYPEAIPDEDQLQALQHAIDQLPEKCRQVFELVVMDNHSYKKAANQLDISINTVKTQLYRAMQKIRKKLV